MSGRRELLLIIFYGLFATLTVFYGLVERHSLLVTFVSFHLVACLLIPLYHAYREGRLKESWQQAWGNAGWSQKTGIVEGAAWGCLFLLIIVQGFAAITAAGVEPAAIRAILQKWGLTVQWVIPFAVYMVVVNSLLEEIMWRGFVQERLLSRLSPVKAMVVSSFFYALYHLVVAKALFGLKWGFVVTLLVFTAGMIWAWLKQRHQAVYPTWISHLLADVGMMICLFHWVY